MREHHAFNDFVPKNAQYLILGSFTAKEAVKGSQDWDESYDWYYGTKRNQFWPILEAVYGVIFPDKKRKEAFFEEKGIGIADIIEECERKDGNNLDSNLINKNFNKRIPVYINGGSLRKILLTSHFVEINFKREYRDDLRLHPEIKVIYLPSPSPRNARWSKEQKIARYKELLPK